MKKNIIKIVLFGSILIVISLSINSALMTRFHAVRDGEVGVWNDILNGRVNADVLISGDSRALTGFDCRPISSITNRSCYNISINGNLIDLQLARFKLYMKNNRHPEVFVQVMGRSTLGQSTPFSPLQFVPFLNHDELYGALMQGGKKDIFIKSKILPLFGVAYLRLRRSLNIINDLFASDYYDMRIHGFLPVRSKWNLNAEQFKIKHAKGIRGNFREEGVTELSVMVDFCKANGIRFVLVVAPMYVEGRDQFVDKDKLLSLYQEIAENQEVAFLNYFDHELTNRKGYFYNYQHTNVNGAQALSRIFASDLRRILPKK